MIKHYFNGGVLQGAAPAPNPPPQKMLCQKRLQPEKMIAAMANAAVSAQFHFKS
jgi:hypothetical protein